MIRDRRSVRLATKLPNKTTRAAVAISGTAALTLSVLSAGVAGAHGYVDQPPSRQMLCANGEVDNCGAIQWEPQSVEGPGGFPAAGPADGELCSGGNARFSELDDPRGGDWPTENIGRAVTIEWTNTARHATANWRYDVTKPGAELTGHALKRPDFQLGPCLTVDGNGEQPPATVTHRGQLPAGTHGKQVILGVWEVADTANAFYSCMDVNVS